MKRYVFASLLVVLAIPAHATITLSGGRVARIKDKAGGDRDAAIVKFASDPGLSEALDPRCPASSSIRLTAASQGNVAEEIPLDCGKWRAAGSGFRYADSSGSAGGVQRIVYKVRRGRGTLTVKMKGPNFTPIDGPIPFLEFRFRVGDTTHCGRFSNFKRNEADKILLRGPSEACEPLCGDGVIEAPEQCEGSDLGGQTCASLGKSFGQLRCNSSCRFDTSSCGVQICGNGNLEPGETCDDGNRVGGDCCSADCQLEPAGSRCGDNDVCNGVETCDGAGSCQAGTPLECDDGNICTDDTCDPVDGCRSTPNVSPCDDSDACTTADTCSGGVCVGGPPPNCDDGNLCTSDTCDSAVGCRNTAVPGAACQGDGNFCTDDFCDASANCIHVNNTRACDDGQECTVGDTCTSGTCVGTFLPPWINEIDYDDFSQPPLGDRDEFVEIAGPAGLDLSGYALVSVEGNPSCLTGVDPISGLSAAAGDAHYIATIPSGTVLSDDTGSGVGLFVACFKDPASGQPTSTDVAGCDAVLPAASPDSNLMDGDPLNQSDTNCPDGLLLIDPSGNPIDAISWEGVVPNTGTWGVAFYEPAVAPAYSIPRDEGGSALGDASGVSIEKNTNDVARAASASEWSESGGCVNQDVTELTLGTCAVDTATPGLLNSSQSAALLRCPKVTPGCGNGIVDPGEDCEIDDHCAPGWVCSPTCACTLATLCGNGVVDVGEQCDEGAANSDEPNATCRTDCRLQRCGDGVTDDAFGESCETNAECPSGQGCFQCGCTPPLGSLSFSVVPGVQGNCPADDGESTMLKVAPALAGICNGTNGDFNPGPLLLDAAAPGPDGKAELTLANGPVVIGASLPDPNGFTVEGYICFQITQDPAFSGWVDCDGGSSANVNLSVDSHGGDADDPPQFEVGADGADSGAGAAVLRVILRAVQTSSDSDTCATVDFSGATPLATAFTTSTATATIYNTYEGGNASVSLTGQPFDCSHWVGDGGASIAMPNASTDVNVPVLGRQDVAQALRLNDD